MAERTNKKRKGITISVSNNLSTKSLHSEFAKFLGQKLSLHFSSTQQFKERGEK